MAQNLFDTLTATVANGASLSGVVTLGQRHVVAIILPAAWTTADLTVQGSADGLTFADVYDAAGNEVTIKAAASRYVQIDYAKLAGFQSIKLRSGTTGTPVNQAAARSIVVVARPYA